MAYPSNYEIPLNLQCRFHYPPPPPSPLFFDNKRAASGILSSFFFFLSIYILSSSFSSRSRFPLSLIPRFSFSPFRNFLQFGWMTKKAKNGGCAAMGQSMTFPSWCSDRKSEARLLFKYQILLEVCHDLRKENVAKRRKLLKFRKMKIELLSIVKFLRKKLKSFYGSPSETEQFEFKRQPDDTTGCTLPPLEKSVNQKLFHENPSQTEQFEFKKRFPDDMSSCKLPPLEEFVCPGEVTLAGGNQQPRESRNACFPVMVDLNLLPLQDVDEACLCDAACEPPESWTIPAVHISNFGVQSKVENTKRLMAGRGFKNKTSRVRWKDPVVSAVHVLPLCGL